MNAQRSAEETARIILDEHWSGGSLNPELSIDPVAIARSLDIRVYVAKMVPSAVGALTSERGADPSMYLSSDIGFVRQRFVCAQQIGYFAWFAQQGREYFDRVQYVGDHPSHESVSCTQFADDLARALLMPAHLVKSFSDQSVWKMAKVFEVPPIVMGARLRDLHL